MGFPGGSEVKASASNAGDQGSIPGSGNVLSRLSFYQSYNEKMKKIFRTHVDTRQVI